MSNDAASGQGGYAGQQGISDAASEFNVLDAIIAGALGRVRTMAIVKVMAVTNDGELSPVGFVDVLPLVKLADGVGNVTPHGTVNNLCYFRLQGGYNAIIIDPKVGDIGIAVIADRDSSSVKANKAESAPGSKRRFSLPDGVYVGGILNGTPEQYVQFTDEGIKLADKNGNVLEMKAGGTFVTGSLIVDGNLQLSGQILGLPGTTYPGNIKIGGDVTAKFGTGASVNLATHTHTQDNDSHGDAEKPTAAPSGGT